MASITIDSELMSNYVSSVPVPAGSHHVALLDQKRMPMVLCLSNDKQPRLRVCKFVAFLKYTFLQSFDKALQYAETKMATLI